AQVTFVAGQSKVRGRVTAAMLLGDDVLDMKSKERIVVLVEPAVFATILGPPTNEFTERFVHQDLTRPRRASTERAWTWRMAITLLAHTQASYSARSSAVSVPSLHLSASSRTRAWASGSARRLTRARADCRSRQRPTGLNKRSNT